MMTSELFTTEEFIKGIPFGATLDDDGENMKQLFHLPLKWK